jgi:hypothetical protein
MTRDLFTELNISLSDDVMTKLNNLALTLHYNQRSILNHYTDAFTLSLGSDIDNFISKFNCSMAITRIEPASHLIWHKDISQSRTCVINIPLKEYKDQTTYITNQDILKAIDSRNSYPDKDNVIKSHRPYIIPYNYKKLYLINVSEKYHCVFNCSNEYRYLLGIQTGDITYQEGLDYFINLNLTNSQ